MSNLHNTFKPVYSKQLEQLVQKEFTRLSDCYLEHAGATLYSDQQIVDALSDLQNNLYGNPHARNVSSKLTDDAVDQIRFEILEFFKVENDEYSVIFTSGATAALKLVAETFNYKEGYLVHLEDNHTSVLGMRAYAKNVKPLSHEEAFQIKKSQSIKMNRNSNSLFVFPAECNFSGTKYPLTWIEQVQDGALKKICDSNWFCLLDAACFAATSPLDLGKYKPDFVCLSFYKIFGYPTGIGALLVKNSSIQVLQKKYFGGGTVLMALSKANVVIPRSNFQESFEDGTLPFQQILALKHGFNILKRLSLPMSAISEHTFSLGKYVFYCLLTMHHKNGSPAAILYNDTTFETSHNQGGIVNFNLLRSNGTYIGYSEVLHIANLFNIHLRTGCCCNPGACQRHLKLSVEDVKNHFEAGHVCGDQNDLIDGYPTGSVRISFGYMSTKEDADVFLKTIEDCFIDKPLVRKLPSNWDDTRSLCVKKFGEYSTEEKSLKSQGENYCPINTKFKTFKSGNVLGPLKQVFIYPIKSCAAICLKDRWDVVSTGLKYDRQWMIVNAGNVCMTQKNNIRLCLIQPTINLSEGLMTLNYQGFSSISVNLELTGDDESPPCQSKVCGDRIVGWDCGDAVARWLSEILCQSGLRLLRIHSKRISKNLDSKSQLSFANKSQFLLINLASVQCLLKRTEDFSEDIQETIKRFRPNFVVQFDEPFLEDDLQFVQIGDVLLKCLGKCVRCQMICVNQSTGKRNNQPLKALSGEGNLSFGIYLSLVDVINSSREINLKSSVVGCYCPEFAA